MVHESDRPDEPDDDEESYEDDLMSGGSTVGSHNTVRMVKIIWILWFLFLGIYFFS